jgi:cytidyltransferase-like protein
VFTNFATADFDNLSTTDIIFFEKLAKQGSLIIYLWSDNLIQQLSQNNPTYPQNEREYLLNGLRYINQVKIIDNLNELKSYLKKYGAKEIVIPYHHQTKALISRLARLNIKAITIHIDDLEINYNVNLQPIKTKNKKVIVTGCYDWFHSGHLRFFEEASAYGDLYVSVGNDAVLTELKGKNHPLYPDKERWYMVQAVKHVHQAFISSGRGWLDAAPEIEIIQPDIFIVNNDGDRLEKRRFCKKRGIDYIVLERKPKKGLPQRSSTDLRGF